MNTICLSFCLRCVVLDVSDCLKLYQHWIKVSTSTQKVKVTKMKSFFISCWKCSVLCILLPISLIDKKWPKCSYVWKFIVFINHKIQCIDLYSNCKSTFFMQPMRLLMLLMMGIFSLPSLPPRKRALEAR